MAEAPEAMVMVVVLGDAYKYVGGSRWKVRSYDVAGVTVTRWKLEQSADLEGKLG